MLSISNTLQVKAPGILLGIGLGGFLDGILLHQLLQWHHMFSSVVSAEDVPGLRMNTLGDGLFHTLTWLCVLAGLGLLYARVAQAPRHVWGSAALWGWMLHGWGWFNLVEGLVNHHVLGIHHVASGPRQLLWDLLFLISGLALMGGGWMLARRARPVASEPPAAPRA